MGRPRSCECGTCHKCKARDRARERYQSLSPEERRALVARRDPDKVRRSDAARYYRHRERRRLASDEYRAANRDVCNEASRRWSAANKDKRRAHAIVARAIKSGIMSRGDCEVCGASQSIHGHHEDYDKPLEVRWLCAPCHAEEHRRYQP